jgi:hypothetical protein
MSARESNELRLRLVVDADLHPHAMKVLYGLSKRKVGRRAVELLEMAAMITSGGLAGAVAVTGGVVVAPARTEPKTATQPSVILAAEETGDVLFDEGLGFGATSH